MPDSGKFVDMQHQAGLDICSFVLVDDIVLGQLIEHLLYFGKELISFGLISRSAELTHSVTCRLCVISVVQSACGSLADTLYR